MGRVSQHHGGMFPAVLRPLAISLLSPAPSPSPPPSIYSGSLSPSSFWILLKWQFYESMFDLIGVEIALESTYETKHLETQ